MQCVTDSIDIFHIIYCSLKLQCPIINKNDRQDRFIRSIGATKIGMIIYRDISGIIDLVRALRRCNIVAVALL